MKIDTFNSSVHLLISILFLFTSCSKSGYFGNSETNDTQTKLSSKQITSGEANGTSSSLISIGETSIKVSASKDVLWNDFTIDLGADFLETNICSGKIIFGRSGSASCIQGTTNSPSTSSDILIGKESWISDGTKIIGTMVNNGTWDLSQSFPSAGFFSGITNAPSASQFCNSATSGQNILGISGTAVCQGASGGTNASASDVLAGKYFWNANGASILGTMASKSFGDYTSSNVYRNKATTQITLTVEKTTTTGYPAGHREVPDVYKDDDGYWSSARGCGATGGLSDTCTTVVRSTRPVTPCGTGAGLNTVDLKIADCFTSNPATSSWSASQNGISGEANWKLVTLVGGKEVWRDERTGFLWGDSISDSWCHASGNGQSDGYCDGNTLSTCTESVALVPAIAGENWGTGVYDNTKGGMGATGTINSPSVRWRLPTKLDWMQAEIDGVRYVLPNMFDSFWTTTIYSRVRDDAWFFGGTYASFNTFNRFSTISLRCLGR